MLIKSTTRHEKVKINLLMYGKSTVKEFPQSREVVGWWRGPVAGRRPLGRTGSQTAF